MIWEEKYIFSMKTNIEAEMASQKFCWPVPKQRWGPRGKRDNTSVVGVDVDIIFDVLTEYGR